MVPVRRLVTGLAGTLASLFVLLAVPAPANAGLPVLARGDITITYTSTAHSVCASGWVDDGVTIVGEWLFEIDGTLVHDTILIGGSSYSEPCYPVSIGLPVGGYVATLSFAAAGTSDFTVVACGVGTWISGQSSATSCGF